MGGRAVERNLTLDRRQILKGAGVLGVGALAALAPDTALANDDQNRGLLGSWDTVHIVEAGPFAGTKDGTFSFSPGGALSANDVDSPATGLGTWARNQEDGFRFTFQEFVFAPQVPKGTKVKVTGVGTIQRDMIQGRFSFDLLDPAGIIIPRLSGSGPFHGKRIQAEVI
jgi:hypothetical protein